MDWDTISDSHRKEIERNYIQIVAAEPSDIPEIHELGSLVQNIDSLRVPLSKRQRADRPGSFPYYGATGVLDYIDDYIFDGTHLLVAEDGSVEAESGAPVLQLVHGQFWANNHAHVLRGLTDADTRYLFYALQTVAIRPYVSGSVQMKLSQKNLRRINVPYPADSRVRLAITEFLDAFSHKIELSRRMAETLEEMASALFKAWFVDFEPVHAKISGRWREGESLPGLPADLHGQFPDSLTDSELGLIPTNWRISRLDEVTDHLRRTVDPSRSPTQQYALYSIPAFDLNRCPEISRGGAIRSNKCIVPPGTILLSRLNPDIKRVWFLGPEIVEPAIASTEFAVLRSRRPFDPAFLYCTLCSDRFRAELTGLVTGTSKSHQRVRPQALAAMKLLVPSEKILAEFSKIVSPWLDQMQALRAVSQSLTALQDKVLPELILRRTQLPNRTEVTEC